MLPKKMAICQQFKKCGKAGCKCNAGALHGPYFYFFYREDGKLKKSYIRKANAAKLWEAYSVQRELQKQRAADRKEFTGLSSKIQHINRLLSDPSLLNIIGDWI
ncbi:MAG TPA: DUF6788 family protein [Blastocatellia bacterium]|nr:DUF6788 family protein [Blastocatellia bacterium]